MNGAYFFYAVVLVFLLGFIDRLRELTVFQSWWEHSIFNSEKLKEKHPALFYWFKSDDGKELRSIKIWKLTIPLHPIFWNLYHSMKNLAFLLVLIYLGIVIHWVLFFFGAWLIWVAQWMSFKIFIKGMKYGN